MTIDQAWHLARRWYGNRLEADFRRPTTAEARQIFEEVGLRGAFWSL